METRRTRSKSSILIAKSFDYSESIVSHIKREPSVEYVLVLPHDEKNKNSVKSQPVPDEPRKCKFCLQEFKKLSWHINEKARKCQTCQRLFKCHKLKIEHLEQEHGGLFYCQLCPYVAKTFHLLKSHGLNHEKPEKCETCDKTFSLKGYLRNHQMHHKHGIYSNVSGLNFKCDICGKCFSSDYHLHGHRANMHLTENASCDICGKIRRNREYIRRHMFIHLKVPCQACGKLVSQHTIKRHMMLHLPTFYDCQLCPKTFKLNKNLKEHVLRMHSTGSGSVVKCTVCEKMTKKHTLKQHMKAHSLQVASKCSLCKTICSSKGVLKSHMKNVHSKVELIDCQFCKRQFKSKCSLKRHVREKHSGDNESL